jgi:hypothetical protein
MITTFPLKSDKFIISPFSVLSEKSGAIFLSEIEVSFSAGDVTTGGR